MNIDELSDKIISNMSNLWPDIYKIRYIYLELGKYLSKDTDFFFSCDNKLYEYNMTYEQIKEAYESKTGINYKVICRSASEILKYVLNKVGIKADVIKPCISLSIILLLSSPMASISIILSVEEISFNA